MSAQERVFKRSDGITAIKPFNAETARPVHTKWQLQKTDVPFTLNSKKKDDLPYCLRGFIPHTCDIEINENSELRQVTLGLLLYEITPTTSGFVYVPTSPFQLSTIETDIFEKFADYELYKHHVINSATDYINQKKHKISPEAVKNLRDFMHEATSFDYSFDFFLIPSVFSDYGIDIEYYRPESRIWGELFDNRNGVNIQHPISKTLLAYVENIMEGELPKMNTSTFTGIEASCLISPEGYERRERKRFSSNQDYPLIKSVRNHRLKMV